mmetsp:Transcript_18819/g.46620  ORF Transcript_18819/g.46620 Transcript_18819/m.46620 type:complete len:581 (+) Transcript_18819:66-1808(+)
MRLARTFPYAIVAIAFLALVHARETGTKVMVELETDLYQGTITGYEATSQLYTVTWHSGTSMTYDVAAVDALAANYDRFKQPFVWQGRYQYFAASSTNFLFDDGLVLVTGMNDTTRSWPPCSECYGDEIRFQWKPSLSAKLTLSLIGFPGPATGYLNMNLLHVDGSSDRTVLSFPNTFQPAAMKFPTQSGDSTFPVGDGIQVIVNTNQGSSLYDGWSCDYLEFQFTGKLFSNGSWTAENVLMGNFLDQGYCPKNIYRPCADKEFCNITNGNLQCTPGRNVDNTIEDRLLAEFECPLSQPTIPPKDEGLLPLEDGIRFDQKRTFLQASSYSYVINDTSKEDTTSVAFPSFPDGFSLLSWTDYEIFNIWRDVTGIERRLNMQFKRSQFSAVPASDDGWHLDLVWVYDNLPDWTEWNSNPDANETGIFVPTGYSLFACESVEFALESTYLYRGGTGGSLKFENMVLGAFLEPDYNVCDGRLPIYHPCPVNEKCQARNGKVSCIPNQGGDVMISRSSGGAETIPSNGPNRFDSWLQCVRPNTTTGPPPDDMDKSDQPADGASISLPSILLLLGSVAYQVTILFM